MGQLTGHVKWFNRNKGYGFVAADEGGEEFFIHHSAITPEGTVLHDNDEVSFDPAETERGKQAQNVTLIKKASE